METLTRIYIFFIGIIALMVCFITWVAIRLRAERINRIRIEKEKQAAETKIHNLEFDIRSLKKSVESYEGLHDGNKQIIDLKQAEITKLEERINRQSDIIKELEQDKENLINCISRTGIRGTDGVVRKCNLGEIQSVISGNHPILNKVEKKRKVKLIQPKPTRDWSVPQAFPEGYSIPEGTKVIKVAEDDNWVKKGSKGIYENEFSINWTSNDYDLDGSRLNWIQKAEELAPLNPLDHPEHPQFNKK